MGGPEMEAPDPVAAGRALRAQKTTEGGIVAEDALDKLKATTAAEFARLGHGLLELADGSFLATKWNCCRALPDLKAARAFLRQIGGAA